MSGGIETLIRPNVDEYTTTIDEIDDDGKKRRSHLIIGGHAAIMAAMVNGTQVIALCGHRFVPSRDPERYPKCPDCVEIEKHLPNDSNPNPFDPDAHLPRRAK